MVEVRPLPYRSQHRILTHKTLSVGGEVPTSCSTRRDRCWWQVVSPPHLKTNSLSHYDNYPIHHHPPYKFDESPVDHVLIQLYRTGASELSDKTIDVVHGSRIITRRTEGYHCWGRDPMREIFTTVTVVRPAMVQRTQASRSCTILSLSLASRPETREQQGTCKRRALPAYQPDLPVHQHLLRLSLSLTFSLEFCRTITREAEVTAYPWRRRDGKDARQGVAHGTLARRTSVCS